MPQGPQVQEQVPQPVQKLPQVQAKVCATAFMSVLQALCMEATMPPQVSLEEIVRIPPQVQAQVSQEEALPLPQQVPQAMQEQAILRLQVSHTLFQPLQVPQQVQHTPLLQPSTRLQVAQKVLYQVP